MSVSRDYVWEPRIRPFVSTALTIATATQDLSWANLLPTGIANLGDCVIAGRRAGGSASISIWWPTSILRLASGAAGIYNESPSCD